MFRKETGYKSSKAAVNVETNIIFASQTSQVVDRIAYSMRIARIRSVDSNSIAVDEGLQVT